jgi:tyrosyl-tRNA synthetase
VNDAAVLDEAYKLYASHIGDDGIIKLSAGKKRHALVKPV